ncbi:MAG TPA: hypothetical protein VEH84_08375 [Alphaproteobacteria bacterium]|nr:hypothetical protein [Alphaproteobacteria bacterium]
MVGAVRGGAVRWAAALIAGLLVAGAAAGQGMRAEGLPVGAQIVESAPLDGMGRPDRALVLWMQAPRRVERPAGEPYTCPDRTRGSHWHGPARLSLVTVPEGRVIDTLPVGPADAFDLPFRLAPGLSYVVPAETVEPAPGGGPAEGVPRLLHLYDGTGDGRRGEVAFYDAQACMGLATTLFGYDPEADSLRQYPVVLEVVDPQGRRGVRTDLWVDYLHARGPVALGTWRHAIDYTGRGGLLEAYDVRFDPARGVFAGTLTQYEADRAPPRDVGAETIAAFYHALARGDGMVAASMVVPEKRGRRPYDPAEMTRFYGGLAVPLQLTALRRDGPDRYTVSYRWASSDKSRCETEAAVTLRDVDGFPSIANIVPREGC